MKIGIFGGTLDPVHLEHINICLATKEYLGLDKILVLPSAYPPHKIGLKFESFNCRLEMAKIAFEGLESFEVLDLENTLPMPGYTFVTVKRLSQIYTDDKLYFIMGADSFLQFDSWKNPDEILKYCDLAVCLRKGYDDQKVIDKAKEFGSKAHLCNYTGEAISSSMLRVYLEFGQNTSKFVGDSVYQYIIENNLYSEHRDMLEKLKIMSSEKRYYHTMYVASEAVKLAMRLGIDTKKAFIAASLHDCTKKLTEEAIKNQFDFELSENLPEPVKHAYSGAYVAEKYFGIKDTDILNSIKYHTTARPNMSTLEKIIYVADCIEDSRDYEGVDKLREIVEKDFEQGFIACLKLTMEQLMVLEDRIEVSDLTKKAYCYYMGIC